MKEFYVQVIDPNGAQYGDGTFVPINRRYVLPSGEFIPRFGHELLAIVITAKPGESGEFQGLKWVREST